MDVLSTAGLIVVVLIVIAMGYYVMRPEKN
jgi:cbb3-type cytochrome oxidase subunit 3